MSADARGRASPAVAAQHRALLSAFHYAAAAFAGCAGLAGFVQITFLRKVLAQKLREASDPLPGYVLDYFTVIVAGVAVLSVCVAIACLVSAPRYRRGEAGSVQWLTAFVLLPWFPFGTALGIYALVCLSGASGRIAPAAKPVV